MKVIDAKQVDIVRCAQQDEFYIQNIQDTFSYLLSYIPGRRYNRFKKDLPLRLADTFYYLLTTASNSQTLGEEYAGILRLTSNNQLPSKLVRIQIVNMTVF